MSKMVRCAACNARIPSYDLSTPTVLVGPTPSKEQTILGIPWEREHEALLPICGECKTKVEGK